MKYRQEVDGLRAIAILPVLLFHSGLPYISGGYLGVDVFFVISGFLITTIIVDDIKSKQFSILTFYERRARRILPALFVMIFFTSIGLVLMSNSPGVITKYGESVISVSLFVSNFYFWMTSGYFGTTSELSLLLHTWSLAVEEQFYVLFPLLAMWFYPKGKKYFINILLVVIFFSLVISEWGWRNSPIGNFYLIPSRAWELLLGSLASLYLYSKKIENLRLNYGALLSNVSLFLIILCYFTFTPETKHPSLLTIVPVLATVSILLFSGTTSICKKFLSSKVLVSIGLISYSLYLWHQPIFALAKLKTSIHLDFATQVVLLITIFIVSYISWRFVESPFRNKIRFSQRRIFKFSIVSFVCIIFTGYLFKENVYYQKFLYPENMARYAILSTAQDSHENQKMVDNKCHFWSNKFDNKFENRFKACSEKYDKAVFIIGGSHAMDLYNAIAINTNNPFVVSVSKGFCRAHDNIVASSKIKNCQYEKFKRFALNNNENIALVVYTQTPDRLFSKTMTIATKNDLSEKHVNQVVDYLSSITSELNLKVLMIGMLPPLDRSPIYLDYTQDLKSQIENNMSFNTIDLTKYLDQVFKDKLSKHNINYVSKFDGFSLQLPKDILYQGEITYSDRRHISQLGETIFGKRLIEYLSNNSYETGKLLK